MNALENMMNRHSIRAFTEQAVPREVLEQLVEMGTHAPSACNIQAWKFCIVDNQELVRQIDDASMGISGNPPAIIVVMSDRDYAFKRGGKFGQKAADEFATLDCAYASQNIMLSAVELGLGTCAIKAYDDAVVRDLLKVPENYVVELLITVGYPDPEVAPRMPERKPLSEVVLYNTCEQ